MKSFTIFFGLSLLLLATNSTSYGQGASKSQTTGGSENLYKGTEVTLKAQVTKKPEPKYTKIARKHQITGTVIIRCVFSKTGEVTNIHVISGLPDGLTDRAVEAAKKIKFIPATKDGHPVSMWMELQYNFNLY
jgi:TonB family protein